MTYDFVPSDVRATSNGEVPTVMVATTALVLVLITDTILMLLFGYIGKAAAAASIDVINSKGSRRV